MLMLQETSGPEMKFSGSNQTKNFLHYFINTFLSASLTGLEAIKEQAVL